MNLEEVKERLYDIVDMFFKGATVIWVEQMNTIPPLPYVTLKVSGINRNTFPVNDETSQYYQCNTKLEINLHTKGRLVSVGNNVISNYANTAMSDLADFFRFVDSDYGVDLLSDSGISIMLLPPIRDLTAIQNDKKYRYRAMAEATVSYTELANGKYGISNTMMVPNSSGGGCLEMAEKDIETIEEVEIIEE